MTGAKAKTVLNAEEFLGLPNKPGSRTMTLTAEIFHAMASDKIELYYGGEPSSMRFVLQKGMQHGDLTTVFRTHAVVVEECMNEFARMRPMVGGIGRMSEADAKKLGNILSLMPTTAFKGDSMVGREAVKTAEEILMSSRLRDKANMLDLRTAAFLSLSEWDGSNRIDADRWRRYARGIEDRVADKLLYNLMTKKHPMDFGRAVLQMLRPEDAHHYPEGTRASVFTFLHAHQINVAGYLGKDKFDVICDRILPTCNEQERSVIGQINEQYAKQPSLDA